MHKTQGDKKFSSKNTALENVSIMDWEKLRLVWLLFIFMRKHFGIQ